MRLRSRAGVAGRTRARGSRWRVADLGLALVGERGVGGGGLAVVVVLGGLQGAQRVVPVGFEAVGDEPVVGVDGQVAAAGEVGAVAGAFDVGAAQLVGFGRRGFRVRPAR